MKAISSGRRFLTVFLSVLVVCSAGCSRQWRAKFIRKNKSAAPAQAILVLQPDPQAVMPASARYQEHYAFWKSWHSDLLGSYGQMRKQDRVNLQGVIGELEPMRALLTGDPSGRLWAIILELREIQDPWNRMPDTWSPPAADRTRLNQLFREIYKQFHYSKVKGSLVPDLPREKPVEPSSPSDR